MGSGAAIRTRHIFQPAHNGKAEDAHTGAEQNDQPEHVNRHGVFLCLRQHTSQTAVTLQGMDAVIAIGAEIFRPVKK